jgi:hypothetical protein
MKKATIILVSFLFITLYSCSSVKINYDKNIDFSTYHTFAFFKKGLDNLKLPAQKKRLVVKVISQTLEQKGFRKSTSPDFVVNIFTDLYKRIDVYPGYYAPWHRRVYKSIEGKMYIDIVDVKTKRVVWTGETFINLQGNDNRKIKKAIEKLLEKFPPPNSK